MIGKVIGSYEITELIGSGGMGSVYRCVDRMLDRDAAIKVLHPDLAHQPQVVERFRVEAKVLARLSHPNIATVYSLLEADGNLFMVLEFVPGRTLEEILKEAGALDLETAADLLGGILAGVEHAHGLEIIHRDLKPANLILSDSGYIKVMDFGIARIVGSDRLTRSGHIVGTLEYMSPEQIQQGEADARSDLYSVGVVLYEMLTGQIPFSAESDFELMKAQLEQPPAAPRELAPEIPEAVDAVILKALAKDPADRYQSAAEMREALAAALETVGGEGAAAARKTRLAAPGPGVTRLAGAPPAPAASGSATPLARAAGWLEGLRPKIAPWLVRARKMPWQYWVIGAAGLALVAGLLFWPRGARQRPDDSRRESRTAVAKRDLDLPTADPSPLAPAAPGARVQPPEGSPTSPTPTQPPANEPPGDDGEPEPSPAGPAPVPARPAPPPVDEPAPTLDVDSLQRSPFERFVDNYEEIDRLVEQMRVAGKSFENEYRSYLKSAGKWKPAGGHRTAWDQVDDFNKATARIKRDLLELADENGLLEAGGARAWMRKARIGARDVGQRVAGDQADASLRRLRTQARELGDRADSISSRLRQAGVSSSVASSWSRLRTLARRVEQLLA